MGSKNGAVNFGGVENKKWSSNELHFVALERFELPQAEPESDVLPLHHKAILLGKKLVLCFCAAKLLRFFKPCKFF